MTDYCGALCYTSGGSVGVFELITDDSLSQTSEVETLLLFYFEIAF